MATFTAEYTYTETTTYSKVVEFKATRDQVVNDLGLVGEDRTEWRDRIEEWMDDYGTSFFAEEEGGEFDIKVLSNESGVPEVEDYELLTVG